MSRWSIPEDNTSVIHNSEVFGDMLFVRLVDRIDVYLSDSIGKFYWSDSTTLNPDEYIEEQETLVYEDLANQELMRQWNEAKELW